MKQTSHVDREVFASTANQKYQTQVKTLTTSNKKHQPGYGRVHRGFLFLVNLISALRSDRDTANDAEQVPEKCPLTCRSSIA